MNKFLLMLFIFISTNALADGMVVDKVYHPYVLANEREVEWRFMSSQKDSGNDLGQRLGYGQSITDNVMIELYVIAERDQHDNFTVKGYEVETRWMITEQGQYWADWGALFEFEKQKNNNDYESTLGLLFEKEFAKTSLTLNFFAIYEWGETINPEWESELRMQYRYRYLPQVQPAIELYAGEDFIGIGPAFMGVHRFDGQKQAKWEVGFITEIAHSEKNHTFRLALEYEF